MTAATTLAAEFTRGSKTRPPLLTINFIGNGRREFVARVVVTDKRAARKMAAERGATPWNF